MGVTQRGFCRKTCHQKYLDGPTGWTHFFSERLSVSIQSWAEGSGGHLCTGTVFGPAVTPRHSVALSLEGFAYH